MIDRAAIAELQRLLPNCVLADQVRLGLRLARGLQELRHARSVSMPLDRWLDEARRSVDLRGERARLAERVRYSSELPIVAKRDEIVAALQKHPALVVAGETGSGKTTQLPKMCLEAGLGARARIGCTQPRRVAALSIARRLAEELQVEYGHEVGSKIRFNDRVRPETSVKVMTDGILLAEVQGDPLLSEYEVVLVDEAHERSLNIDFLLGHLRNLLRRRDDLKVLITSATIDTARFAEAFGGAPVIEVSGRMFPVEVRYRPPAVPDADEEHEGETYVEAAVATVESVVAESDTGDVLVFMPGERDIRETCDRLGRVFRGAIEVLPLFGRLSGGEQDAIFHPGTRRRVVVATNVAETSLTVPRIRYVIDTGLARVSRYHPGTRCRRLPVEPIARSSAEQRKGRCGRVAEGICVRIFAEEDFLERPLYGDPEIRRCNLADVILRLKAGGLGEVETFPFVDAPPGAAIRGGYALLQELGALDDEQRLTDLGRELARLPVDPAIGRMLLEARKEGAVAEVLIVAAGLSIQDPRERPLDRRDAAETAHRRFTNAESDFLTLLNIWNGYHDTWETLKTQSQLRRFCREHFLSFLRMREWVDLHGQLENAMEDLAATVRRKESGPADYASIHRSLVAGLVGHVAERKESNVYRLTPERLVYVFPGSGLCVKSGGAGGAAADRDPSATGRERRSSPPWLVAGEIVETSRPFARTAARIEPQWVIAVAPHTIRRAHLNPRWDGSSQRVLVTERVLLRGLVLQERTVGLVEVDPTAATELFIREALLGDGLQRSPPFLEANRELMRKIEWWRTRLRRPAALDLAEAMFRFYAARLSEVGSAHDLNRLLGNNRQEGFLVATAVDLLEDQAPAFERGGVPDELPLAGESVQVRYAYAPGEDRDGVTFRLSARLAEVVDPRLIDWAVPALREERVLHLLRALPKEARRQLMPLEATATWVLDQLDPKRPGFVEGMSRVLRERFGVDIAPADWPLDELPPHLRPRFEVVDCHQTTLAAGRDLAGLRDALQDRGQRTADPAWAAAVRRCERYDLQDWTIGDLPAVWVVGDIGGYPVKAYPGLHVTPTGVDLRLFRRPEDARASNALGVPPLAARVLARELVHLQHDLRALRRHHVLYATLGPVDELLETGWEHLRAWLLPPVDWPELRESAFRDYVARARRLCPTAVSELSDRLDRVLQKRQQALTFPRPFRSLPAEVHALVPRRLLAFVSWERMNDLPRYLQALLVRAERAAVNPAKDLEKQAKVAPYLRALSILAAGVNGDRSRWELYDQFRWLIEEFKVSIYAQELGTNERVSPARLDEFLAQARSAVSDDRRR